MQEVLDQAAKAGKEADKAKAQAAELQKQVEEIKDKPLFQRQEEKTEGLFGTKKQ
jgi:hypothetical protein